MATPPVTIADLDTQIAELKRQRDLASLAGAKAIRTVLNTGKAASLADDLEALLSEVSNESMAAQQVSNIINVLRGGKSLIEGEINRVEATVPQPEAPPAPPAE